MKLLLAEDERGLSRALVTILTYHHYSVDAAYDGKEALTLLQSSEYDGAILDIMMPVMDGLSVLRELRKTDQRLPVLLLTARNQIDDRVAGLDSGADDYLGKPFDTQELLARIRAMLRRGGRREEDVLRYGELCLDRLNYTLSSPAGAVRLGGKEFQMLEMLMRADGRVISRERFMDMVWGYDSSAGENIVWTYLSVLRKKIAMLSSSVRIRVIRNVGYLLENTHDH